MQACAGVLHEPRDEEADGNREVYHETVGQEVLIEPALALGEQRAMEEVACAGEGNRRNFTARQFDQ